MKLEELAKVIGALAAVGRLDAEARDVTHDSRGCAPGSVFAAIRGDKLDGHRFIPQALDHGAVAIISEQSYDAGVHAPAWIQVADARVALAAAAAAVHGHPSRRLKLIGVTGTNGKTTTAHLIDSIIRVGEGTSAIFGTISHRIGRQSATAQHTTPEASDMQRMLAEAVEAGCRSAVMEVSSHAIELHRADCLHFAVAVFTNLTRDHLDFHRTMENYFAAKEKIFSGALGSEPAVSVINSDDEYGRMLTRSAKGRITWYGFNERADVRTKEYTADASGLRFTAETPAGSVEITSKLVGRPHVYNALAAVATGVALGFDLSEIARGIAECPSVPGRFEQVVAGNLRVPGFSVIVDYAHTDDALQNVLTTARELVKGAGRVIAVFGCGGDRDRTKRAPMGFVAATLSDVTIVSSDNPRSEDPMAIIDDIEAGLKKSGRPYEKVPDRREAIFRAIAQARTGDVVVIAGKGHESYQIIGDRRIHFDDREVAREAMSQQGSGAA
ncbi:MAG TPA: UDP-N-acetylmuramoyl-L-alanyl-D-glutamate--2,6-diaminopimelate ligase [Blastocatellia bacterium]|nr:UDP-N-acetylmuramoyl-L-alanyl-D-glutamate--2,6-diaminopimelate ligase [Blastocatellia bacterium]